MQRRHAIGKFCGYWFFSLRNHRREKIEVPRRLSGQPAKAKRCKGWNDSR
jgi:hypothetical protein